MRAHELDVMVWNEGHSFEDLHHCCYLFRINQVAGWPGPNTFFNRLLKGLSSTMRERLPAALSDLDMAFMVNAGRCVNGKRQWGAERDICA